MMNPIDVDGCERLRKAVFDGRFLEDPGHWRTHVAACSECRRIVEGLFRIESLIAEARQEAPVVETTAEDSRRVLQGVLARYRRRRARVRWSGYGLGVVCVLAVGGAFLLRPAPESDRNPLAYAQQLWARVAPPGKPVRYEILREDGAARREYLEALESPSSLVRRTALWVLLQSGTPIAPERLVAILEGWKETLDAPISVAEIGSQGHRVAEALDAQRSRTATVVLDGLVTQVAQGGPGIPSSAILPFLAHPDAETRRAAIDALATDAGYRPGPEADPLLGDRSAAVRNSTATWLVRRGGADGIRRVAARLRAHRDEMIEGYVAPLLVKEPAGIAFLAERLREPDVAPRVALGHAIALLTTGRRDLPAGLVERAAEDSEVWTHLNLAVFSARADRPDLRPLLQDLWRKAAPGSMRLALASELIRWDLATATEPRLALALEVARAEASARLRPLVEALAACGIASIETAARELLAETPQK